MEIIKPKVELLAITPGSERLIEEAGRTCYLSLDKIKDGSSDSFIRSAIRDKIRIINAQSQIESLEKYKEMPENKLSLEELKRIRSLLERIEKKDK